MCSRCAVDSNNCPLKAASTHLASHEKGDVHKNGLITSFGRRRQQRTPVLSPGVEYVGDLHEVYVVNAAIRPTRWVYYMRRS